MSIISKKCTKSVNFCFFCENSIINFDPVNTRNCIIDLGQNIVAAGGIADSKTAIVDISSCHTATITAGLGRIATAIGPIAQEKTTETAIIRIVTPRTIIAANLVDNSHETVTMAIKSHCQANTQPAIDPQTLAYAPAH